MIEIKNGCKTYKSKTGESVKALDNVNIAFPETGIIFITGKSGSGKSTLLNVLGGIDKLDSGELIINGRNINELSINEKNAFYNEYVGFIYQDYNLLEYMSVKYNILLPYYISNKKWDENRLEEILEKLCIKELKDRPVNELSGGQKQRVAITRSILQNTKIILADEPTGALDHDNSEELYKTLKELSKDILIIVVSHDLEGAEKYSDYTIKMQDGVLDNSSNVEIENNNNLNLKPKKNMCFKEAFKLGMKMLYRKKIRLILSLILMVLSIGMLTIAVSLSEFNSYKILTKAMDDYSENNIAICKIYENYAGNFTENDIDKVNNINSTGYKVYNIDFYSTEFDLAVEYSDKFKNDFDLKLLSGKLPEENQCLVSSSFFCHAKLYGYNENEINSFDDLIGNELSSSNAKFVISGIFDDGYDDDFVLKYYTNYRELNRGLAEKY